MPDLAVRLVDAITDRSEDSAAIRRRWAELCSDGANARVDSDELLRRARIEWTEERLAERAAEADKWLDLLKLVLPLAGFGATMAHPDAQAEMFSNLRRANDTVNRSDHAGRRAATTMPTNPIAASTSDDGSGAAAGPDML